ncbi:UvrD-helicase domain-containing protein [Parvularcula sp. LCG005]|uniref:UvrD-helicase domain-containing protein n=1 Tax=Parvularcula sp. LCG005 TaxID=3078805 RepID=UPI0029435752|nr:UvrD-helicase domain-containing protein [Parvularcula sp. LCG005]WOI52289.1 UvrD-helicase domain-containing protein [Parvularcula sp. LCG005]
MTSKPSLAARAAASIAPRPAADAAYLDGLNPPQREAVLTTEGPVLMLAGAGTGKTKALTSRLAHLLASGKAQPWQLLAVTFTNKAAREMRHRIGAIVGETVEGMRWLGTFHSIGAQILRRHAEVVGLKSSFTIIDTDDQLRLCKQVIEAAGLDEKRWTGRALAGVIDNWKNAGLIPTQVPKDDAWTFADGKAIDLYRAYQERLVSLNAADFGDLLVHNLSIFRAQPDILATYHKQFRYMMVDEYQDTNVAQYLWLRLLAQRPGTDEPSNICVVGDDDQSIYGWRGAEVENILRFEKDFPGAKVIRLEQNYRSTPSILAAASSIISRNEDRLGKTLWTALEEGECVRLRGVWDADEEARTITDDIEAEQSKGRSLSDIAVLVRASFQMRSFEERFNTAGIPYQVVGGPRFYEREETRDALAYLRLVRNPDDDLSFSRIINKPRRGFGDKALQTLMIAGRSAGVSLFEAAQRLLETDEVKGKAKTSLRLFIESLHRWRALAADVPPGDLSETVLEESGYTDFWRQSKSVQSGTKLENLKELVQAASEFETLDGYLDHVSLVAERSTNDDGSGMVWLMTLHAAKGLEYPVVFLPGWEEDLFPSGRSLDESGKAGLEEERRLAYVGITRARESCRISFAANRQVYGRWQSALPSRFIDELPEEHVDVISEPGLYGVKARDMPSQSRFDAEALSTRNGYDTPGWRRAQQSRRTSRPPAIEGSAKLIASSAAGSSPYKVGDRVFHRKFGDGTVQRNEGNKVTVHFDDDGEKKVISSFLTPSADG